MQRRTLVLMPAALALTACGFQLRQQPELAFRTIYAGFKPTSPLGAELRRALASSGNTRLIENPRELSQAQVIMDVLTDQREKVVVGVGAVGQVREFQLRVRFRFRLRTPQGRELIDETELLLQRDLSFNETAVLAREQEEDLLYRDMQSDIVQQVLRRLAAVRLG